MRAHGGDTDNYSFLSGNLLHDVIASPQTGMGLNMFAKHADTSMRGWFAPSLAPLLAKLGADGFVMVGAQPQIFAQHRHIDRVGCDVALWIADAAWERAGHARDPADGQQNRPERFQIDFAVQDSQATAIDQIMHGLDQSRPKRRRPIRTAILGLVAGRQPDRDVTVRAALPQRNRLGLGATAVGGASAPTAVRAQRQRSPAILHPGPTMRRRVISRTTSRTPIKWASSTARR